MGTVGILNVGAGDTKLTFDKNNPAESIRAGRIVRDMIRRGYALLVEVDRDGEKRFERALDFDENTAEYLIADFDPRAEDYRRERTIERELSKPLSALVGPKETEENGEESTAEAGVPDAGAESPAPTRKARKTKRVAAASTRAVSVARSAGG